MRAWSERPRTAGNQDQVGRIRYLGIEGAKVAGGVGVAIEGPREVDGLGPGAWRRRLDDGDVRSPAAQSVRDQIRGEVAMGTKPHDGDAPIVHGFQNRLRRSRSIGRDAETGGAECPNIAAIPDEPGTEPVSGAKEPLHGVMDRRFAGDAVGVSWVEVPKCLRPVTRACLHRRGACRRRERNREHGCRRAHGAATPGPAERIRTDRPSCSRRTAATSPSSSVPTMTTSDFIVDRPPAASLPSGESRGFLDVRCRSAAPDAA